MTKTINIKDLNPRESTFDLAGKTYTLKKFSLAARVWVEYEFSTPQQKSGLMALSDMMRDLDPGAFAKVSYYLLKDKSDFPTIEKFIDALGDDVTILGVLGRPIVECFGVSNPDLEDIEEDLELKKPKAAR